MVLTRRFFFVLAKDCLSIRSSGVEAVEEGGGEAVGTLKRFDSSGDSKIFLELFSIAQDANPTLVTVQLNLAADTFVTKHFSRSNGNNLRAIHTYFNTLDTRSNSYTAYKCLSEFCAT